MAWSVDRKRLGRRRVASWLTLLAVPLAGVLVHHAAQLGDRLHKNSVKAPDSLAHIDLRQIGIRVRVTAIEPKEAVKVQWRHGGEGLGGAARRGSFVATSGSSELKVGEWSESVLLDSVLPADIAHDIYLTIFAGSRGKPAGKNAPDRRSYSRKATFEVEYLHSGKVLRRFMASSPAGATVTLAIPGTRRDGLVDELGTAFDVANRRQQFLLQLPWARRPLPSLYPVVSDLGGFGTAWGYGVRVSDPRIMTTELAAVLQLGANGLRAAPDFIVKAGRGSGKKWRARIVGPAGYPVPRIPKKRDLRHEAGCPFGPQVAERQRAALDTVFKRAAAANAEEVWALTVDEIGAVTDRADNGKQHLTTCERCRRGFVDFLKRKNLHPVDVAAKSWDEVRPLSVWKPETKPWLGNRALSRRAFLTREFLNVASAALFTPLRDALAAHNAQVNDAPKIYSYALRGNNFLSNGSSLDYFEFYRHADNAIVWETSNRDARAWPWDSYLCDVQRVLKRELGIEAGIYVKPHRGAPVQRMLSALSRGNSLLYWYTYGPDYWKGDAFAGQPKPLELTSKAAHLLGGAERFLYGATLHARPRVAIVRPQTTWSWMALAKSVTAQGVALESGKWIYTALQHAHVPVDPLDEQFLTTMDLSGYSAIYVDGTHVTAAAAQSLVRYVHNGGTLVTSGFGLARDETDSPLSSLLPVLGVTSRGSPEMWCNVPMYRAGQVGVLTPLTQAGPPATCAMRDSMQSTRGLAELPLVVGREVLRPKSEGDVVARFRDGAPAAVRHRYGAGVAWLFGGFLGVEYAEPVLHSAFDMRRDFSSERRNWITTPLNLAGLAPVSCSDPLVETVLLRSAAGRGHALSLINWAYKDQASHAGAVGLVKFVSSLPTQNVQIVVRMVTAARRVRSTWLDTNLPFQATPDGLSFVVPTLEEGDVITIE